MHQVLLTEFRDPKEEAKGWRTDWRGSETASQTHIGRSLTDSDEASTLEGCYSALLEARRSMKTALCT